MDEKTPIADTPVEDTVRIVVQMKGVDKHPDDGPGQWFKAVLWWGIPGGHGHIEAISGSPEEAVKMALSVWRRNHA